MLRACHDADMAAQERTEAPGLLSASRSVEATRCTRTPRPSQRSRRLIIRRNAFSSSTIVPIRARSHRDRSRRNHPRVRSHACFLRTWCDEIDDQTSRELGEERVARIYKTGLEDDVR